MTLLMNCAKNPRVSRKFFWCHQERSIFLCDTISCAILVEIPGIIVNDKTPKLSQVILSFLAILSHKVFLVDAHAELCGTAMSLFCD